MTQNVTATTGTLHFWRSLFAAFPPTLHMASCFSFHSAPGPRNSAKFREYFVQFRISQNNQIPISWPPYIQQGKLYSSGQGGACEKKENCKR